MTFIERTQALIGNAEIIAFAILPQGYATAPNGVVLYKKNHAVGDCMVHYVNFENDGLMIGYYPDTVAEGWLEFFSRLEKNVDYVRHGTPLTGEPQ